MSRYPAGATARDRFVIERRPDRIPRDPWAPPPVAIEDERTSDGTIARVGTVFLTGRECAWRCVMCDLWQHTIEGDTPPGAIAAQVAAARRALAGSTPAVTQVKLYNAGSFFDPRAVPEGDADAMAAAVSDLDRVIVESHPALVGARTARWMDALARHARADAPPPALEVAMGLETAHPAALARLNKRMTGRDFARAADWLARADVALRVFLLVSPPFVPDAEQDAWLGRSVDAAAACGASVISLIPTRTGQGAIDALIGEGLMRAPTLDDLERSVDLALARVSGRPSAPRVFADLWDLARFPGCARCIDARRDRLRAINLTQAARPRIACAQCGAGSAA
jgi:radical SAM enzyme (TIGR01210 family)